MNDIISRGIILQITLGQEEQWSGSGFIITTNAAATPIQPLVITSTSWMRDVLVIPKDLYQSQPCLLKDAKINVYWLNENVFQKSPASVFCIKYLNKVHQTLKELEQNSLNEWALASNYGNQDHDLVYLSCLVLISIETNENMSFPPIPVSSVSLADDVCIVSTPFGTSYPKIFHNSISRGCVSNTYSDTVYMIDTRCTPGSEGGVVLKKRSKHQPMSLVGVVISNLVDGNNIPVNASLVCSVTEDTLEQVCKGYLSSLSVSVSNMGSPSLSSISTVHSDWLSSACDGVVPVMFGSSVGSGVILSDSHVITCAHVVKGMTTGIIRYCNRSVPVTVLYSAHGHPDIAILLVNKVGGGLNTNNFLYTDSDFQCSVGEPVISIGYTYQNPFLINAHSNPSISTGIVSKLVSSSVSGGPVMIHTTSCVYEGMSGGLLYSIQSHMPLGILASVARDDRMSVSYSNVSFVIPFSWIKSAIQNFILSKDFDFYSFSNLEGSQVWLLNTNNSPLVKTLSCKL